MNASAIMFTRHRRAELLPVEVDPTPLAPNQVAGKTIASLISPGTELNAGFLGDIFPRRTGYAAVFRVEEVGEEVHRLRPGDLVYCMAPHQSFQRVPEEDALPVPEGLSPFEAVFARLIGVSMSTLTTTTSRPPQRVLVTGLGIIGNLAAQVFQACGYEVIACDPSEVRRQMAHTASITHTCTAVPVEDLAGTVALVVECSGNEQALLDGCSVVCKRGEVVLVGVPWRRQTELSAFDLTDVIFHRYVVVRSGREWEVPLFPQEFRTGSIHENQRGALNWLAQGKISVKGLYDQASPADCQQVYEHLLDVHWHGLTAVFVWERI